MRWLGAWRSFLLGALVATSCTSAPVETAPTSLTLGAPEAVAQTDEVLRYGISTTPPDPWVHYRTSCDTSCGLVFGALTDTLFATSLDGSTVGLLVERHETNSDSTLHTWRLRDGIRFTDGSPLDADAVKANVDACRHSALTGPGLAGIDDVRAEGLTLTITTLAPWGNLPVHFAETPCGHMFSGSWLRSLADLPMRLEGAPFFDAEIAAVAATGDPAAPVGLGAFVMTSFEPGNGNSTFLERNASYWRGPSGITGESLPRAEQIELVVIRDDAIRTAGLETGQLDVVHTRDPLEAAVMDGLGPLVRSQAHSDVVHLAFNAADASPLRFVSCRRAIDRAIDRNEIGVLFGQDVAVAPVQPLGLVDQNDDDPVGEQTAFDPGPAGQWAQRCVEDHAQAGLSLEILSVEGDARADLVASMIEQSIADGDGPAAFSVEVVEAAPADLGLAVLLGEYDLVLWEGFGGVHPDLHFQWWFSEAASPVGSIATNVSRIDDPAVDRALVDLRRASDVEESNQATNDVVAALAGEAWTSWLTRIEWAIGYGEFVGVDFGRSTPEGIELVPFVEGTHSLHRVSEA